ncbi:MAG: EFR1 family ferrodoxin [Smithella sp.]
METVIYCCTGTGNSLWTAKQLSALLNNTVITPIPLGREGKIEHNTMNIGFIFPVHIWGIPAPVVNFLNRLELDQTRYYFAVAVNAGQVAATLIQLQNLLQKKNGKLSSGFSVCLPSNYIPWGGAESPAKQQKKFSAAMEKISTIASSIRSKKEMPPEKGPVWQNIFLSAIYHSSYSYVSKMDKSFWADERCTPCGICEKICPAQNIWLINGKPQWQHRCEQCFACLQWCPEEAIQYGKGTSKKKRYHHPEVTLKDMLACIPKKEK